jgi:hypothetical protein
MTDDYETPAPLHASPPSPRGPRSRPQRFLELTPKAVGDTDQP